MEKSIKNSNKSTTFKIYQQKLNNADENKINFSNESDQISKEKCGEILITNYGIFEINCLLCDHTFKNIKNYAKHILQHHFDCDPEYTIKSLIDMSHSNEEFEFAPLKDSQFSIPKIEIEDEKPDLNEFLNLDIDILDDNLLGINNSNNKNFLDDPDDINLKLFDTNSSKKYFTVKENSKQIDSDIDDIPLNKLKVCHKLKNETKHDLGRDTTINIDNECNEISDNNCIKNERKDASNIEIDPLSKKLNPKQKTFCKICGKQTSRYKMAQHLRSHDNSRYVHKCKTCLKLFISEKSLNFHIMNLHTEEKPFVCDVNNCGRRFVNENALNTHMKRHGDKPFTCEICSKGFLYKSRLNDHINQHILKLRKETGLEKSTDSNAQLALQLLNNNNSISDEISKSDVEIKFDGSKRKKFKQKQIIKIIKKTKQNSATTKSIPKLICDICGKEKPKTHMKRHLQSHDSSRYTHKCDMCNKLFISEKSLDLHIKNLHIKDKPFACTFEHCDRRFVNENALKSHIFRHTSPREFKCETCNKGFIYQYRLEEHIKVYHVNGRVFACELCDRRFYDKHTLERHHIVHRGEKPFKCDECPSKFTRQRSLDWHKKSHTGIKDYSCKICGKQYALYNGIYSHMKVHGIKYSVAYEKGLTDGKTDIENIEIENNI